MLESTMPEFRAGDARQGQAFGGKWRACEATLSSLLRNLTRYPVWEALGRVHTIKEGALLRPRLCRVATNACLESMLVV